jgi:hypothetical protein
MDLVQIAPVALLIASLVLAETVVNGIRRLRRSPEEKELFERAQRAVPGPAGPGQRQALKGCANCRGPAITLPFKDGSGRTYCSEECLLWGALGPTTFCERCRSGSEATVSAGPMNHANGTGRGFGRPWSRCRDCRSVLRRVWFQVLHVPIVPLGTYRVIHESPRRFRSQKATAA